MFLLYPNTAQLCWLWERSMRRAKDPGKDSTDSFSLHLVRLPPGAFCKIFLSTGVCTTPEVSTTCLGAFRWLCLPWLPHWAGISSRKQANPHFLCAIGDCGAPGLR